MYVCDPKTLKIVLSPLAILLQRKMCAMLTGVPARCFIMDTPVSVARHLNFVRQIDTEGEVRRVPDVAYNIYKSKFTEPELKEGFEEIVKVCNSQEIVKH